MRAAWPSAIFGRLYEDLHRGAIARVTDDVSDEVKAWAKQAIGSLVSDCLF